MGGCSSGRTLKCWGAYPTHTPLRQVPELTAHTFHHSCTDPCAGPISCPQWLLAVVSCRGAGHRPEPASCHFTLPSWALSNYPATPRPTPSCHPTWIPTPGTPLRRAAGWVNMALGCLTPPFLPVFLDSGLLANPQEATSTVLPKEAQVSPICAPRATMGGGRVGPSLGLAGHR